MLLVLLLFVRNRGVNMNKIKSSLLALSCLCLLAGCAQNLDNSSLNETISSNDAEALNAKLASQLNSDEILLNLTKYGLYNGNKGNSSSEYNLENYVILSGITVEQALPTSEQISSSVANVKFVSWCYPNKGELSFTKISVTGQKYYQAYFEYDESAPATSSAPTTSEEQIPTSQTPISKSTSEISSNETSSSENPSSSSTNENLRTIYFVDNEAWNTAAAYTWIYLWGDNGNLKAWPGTAMTHVEYNTTTKANTYSFEYDKTLYNKCIFNRCPSNTDGTVWNQTADLIIPTDLTKNCAVFSGTLDSQTITWTTK